MSAYRALPGVRSFSDAIELHERPGQDRLLLWRNVVVALEGGLDLAGQIGPACGQIGVEGIAEVLRALPSIGEVCDARQVAAPPCPDEITRKDCSASQMM